MPWAVLCPHSSMHPVSSKGRGTQAARLIFSSLRGSPISVKKIKVRRKQKAIEGNDRTFLQVLEERDVQEIIFSPAKVSPIGRPSLPLATLLPASRFGVAIAGRF